MFKLITSALLLTSLAAFQGLQADSLKESSGVSSNPYIDTDGFPQAYFLIPRNLPHLMHTLQKNMENERLAINGDQKKALADIHSHAKTKLPPTAIKIKELELEIMNAVLHEGKTAEQLQEKILDVANMRTEMTNAQIACLNQVKALFSGSQYAELLKIAKSEAQ